MIVPADAAFLIAYLVLFVWASAGRLNIASCVFVMHSLCPVDSSGLRRCPAGHRNKTLLMPLQTFGDRVVMVN
jgi:hypothetical protein